MRLQPKKDMYLTPFNYVLILLGDGAIIWIIQGFFSFALTQIFLLEFRLATTLQYRTKIKTPTSFT